MGKDRFWLSGRFGRHILRFAALATIGWFVLYGPSAIPDPFFRKEVYRSSRTTQVWEDSFRIDDPI